MEKSMNDTDRIIQELNSKKQENFNKLLLEVLSGIKDELKEIKLELRKMS